MSWDLEDIVKVSNSGYDVEIEIEKEKRVIVEAGEISKYEWTNHVVDVYDKSGRCRIRVKNDKPRFSIKVPLFSKDSDECKVCIRIELKPLNEEQEDELLRLRGLILEESDYQMSEKWGALIGSREGHKTWINRDTNNSWWIEVDEGVELSLPDGMKILGLQKSNIKVV